MAYKGPYRPLYLSDEPPSFPKDTMMESERELMKIGEETRVGSMLMPEYVALQAELSYISQHIDNCNLKMALADLVTAKGKADWLKTEARWKWESHEITEAELAHINNRLNDLMMDILPDEMAMRIASSCECKRG